MCRNKPRPAFSLIELVVVLAIIGVLMALGLAAVQRVRDAAARTVCMNHLKQIGLALHQYHDAHRTLPPGCSYQNGASPQPHMSWMTRILPQLEEDALWRQAVSAFGQDRFFETPPHLPILGHVLPAFTCPADSRTLTSWDFGEFSVAFTAYQGMAGTDRTELDGLFYVDSRVRFADVTDGLANTLAVGERPPGADHRFGWWYAGWGQRKDGSADSVLGARELNVALGYSTCPRGPYHYGPGRPDNPCDVFHFWGPHLGGANFLFADGSVRLLTYSADAILPAMATRAGGEPADLP